MNYINKTTVIPSAYAKKTTKNTSCPESNKRTSASQYPNALGDSTNTWVPKTKVTCFAFSHHKE